MQWDVIVAGGGPSGLTLAAELAGSGARTLVLERRQGGVQSRAGTVLPRLLELFDARGIAERFIERTREIAAYPFRPTHIWAGFTPIEWRHLETRFGFTLGLPQNHTEDILRQWAGDSGAEIRHGTALQAFREDGDGVRVEALDASGESHTLRARYLIGADGGRSTVRELGGFAFDGHAGTFRGIAVDAELEAPWPGGRIDIDNHMGWVRGYVFGAGITRFNIVHRDRRHAPRDEPVTVDEVRQCIRDVHGTDYGIERLRWASRFDDQMRAVPCLRRGRVFLVGESARVHYPASGVGMNFCLQDAFNLGWKMANVIQGIAPESTLDSYHAERYPVMQALLASVRAQCALQFNFSPEGVALKRRFAQHLLPLPEVQRQLVRELCGLENPYDTGPGSHALAGRCLPDFDVITLDGRSRRVAQMLRNRRFVLLDLEGYSGQFAQLDLTGLPVDLVPARLGRPPASMTGVKALLIRPDAYVDWASDELAGTAQLEARLARWFER